MRNLSKESLSEKFNRSVRISGILGLALLAAIAIILEQARVIDILANLTDIFTWIAAPIVGFCFGLIAKGGTWKGGGKLSLRQKPKATPMLIPEVQPYTPTPALEGLDRADLITRAMLGYRGLLKLDLLDIAKKFDNEEQLQFPSWNNTQPELKKQLIGDDDLYNALQDFSSSLNDRNNSVGKLNFEIWNNRCKNHYDKLIQWGFVNAPREQARPTGLEVYTRTDFEQKYPFKRFLSQVKQGGELVMLVGAFSKQRYDDDTIKRLITEKNATVTILLLAPTITKTVPAIVPTIKGVVDGRIDFAPEIEKDFEREGLIADIQQTLKLLCKLRRDLKDVGENHKDLRSRLIIRTYDRTPILSMIVIDPNTEGAIMQVGTYLSGTDPSFRFQILLSKKDEEEVFEKYWAEYKLIEKEHSHEINYKKIEDEFLS